MGNAENIAAFHLRDETATAQLGMWLAQRLVAGDCLMLCGPIGAGKSHLARSLIWARLGRMEDVPSPTFTLVQTYNADVEIWHADLYRLTHCDDIIELGLEEAFSTAICLIEWPDRLAGLAPENSIWLQFTAHGAGRNVRITSAGRPDLFAALIREWHENA